MKHCVLLVSFFVACVKGDPDILGDDDGTFTGEGGKLAIPGCGYEVTTRLGAEAPKLATPTFGQDPTPLQVHLGLMSDPRTSIVMQWRTVDETTRASTVRFAAGADLSAADLTETATGIQFAFRATGMETYRVHQVHLCDLAPGTSYSYQVGGTNPITGSRHYSKVFTFRTAPDVVADPSAEVVLGFVGDVRGGYDTWQQLIDQLRMRSVDAVLFSGDAVTVGLTQYEWEDFFARAEPLFATAPVIAAHGNHEVNAVNFYSQLALPGDQQNFGLDYGHAHVTVGNDSPEDPNALMSEFRDAIAADFKASSSARWKLFMHHRPLWSASTRHGANELLQQAWGPIIDQYKIDLVLNGHDHDYEITKPLVAGQVQGSNANATVFVVSGGAGAELYGNGMEYFTQFSESAHSAAVIHVRRDQLTLTPFHPDGTPLDAAASFSKTK